MRWRGARQSTNIEDRRRRVAVGGGLGTIVFILIALFFGADPAALLQDVQTGGDAFQNLPQAGETGAPLSDEHAQFIATVLADTEDTWNELFRRRGMDYVEPTLVLFRDRVHSACGLAAAAVGPFYCPGDAKVYLDLSFFEELERRFQAPGDFAQAYVVAHEIGHHVQNLLGITDEVHRMRGELGETEYNELSVRLELQADFLAGVWAHHAHKSRDILEAGDIEEGLRAASAIGDDAIQRRTQGHVVPDSFTHGTSEQRVRWFKKGLRTGDLEQGDTFAATNP